MNKPIIVKNWTTHAGLPAMVLLMPLGHHCGYVGIPADHPAYGKNYDDESLYNIDVHGGLTYAGTPPMKGDSKFWALGYDCAHLGDLIPYATEHERTYLQLSGHSNTEVFRDLDYCTAHCEHLAEQLADLSDMKRLPPPSDWKN